MAEAAPEIDEYLRDIGAMSFEEALGELEAIVKRLETGGGRLEEAISSYQRGAALKRHCESKLAEARAKVDRISLNADGSLRADAQAQD